MTFAGWADDLTLGVPCLDRDHGELLGLLDRLFDAVACGKQDDALAEMLDRLVVCGRAHSAREEELMASACYQDLDGHRAEHDAFAQAMLAVRARHGEGEHDVLSLELLQTVRAW